MRKHEWARAFLALTLLILSIAAPAATRKFVPTTTLAVETTNNTSGASTFAGLPNGNLSPSNISKVSVHTLLNPGTDLKIYAHSVGWWGYSSGGHPNVGYKSNDPAHVKAELDDMQSRGINGLVLDWYGMNSSEEKTLQALAADLQTRPGFDFVVMLDSGMLQWSNTPCYLIGICTATQGVEQQITYLRNNYFSHPNIAHRGSKVLLSDFGMEAYPIDWAAIQTANPDTEFIHRNTGGYGKADSAGAYAWLSPVTTSYSTYEGLPYLIDFYAGASKHLTKLTMGSTYRGFDDSIASWAPPGGRHIASLCGKTWMDTWAQVRQNQSSLDSIQLVTWDDYQEGSELETGIDNCIGIATSITGSVLSTTVNGDPSMVSSYTVFVSTDGQNLMDLDDSLASPNVDLSNYNLAPGSYSVFVKAIGQPMTLNHMSNSVSFNVINQPPIEKMALSTNAGTAPLVVSASVNASDVDGSIAGIAIDFGDGTVVNASSALHTYSTPGTYTVTSVATDDLGATVTTTDTVIVASPVLPKPVVNITQPASGITNAGPAVNVHVIASSQNGPISCFIVYVNSVPFGSKICGVSAFAEWVSVPVGKSNVTVNAWDSIGQVGKSSIVVTRPQ